METDIIFLYKYSYFTLC